MSYFENSFNFKETMSNEAKRSDLYQVLEYARKRDIGDIYLLYSMYRLEQKKKIAQLL